MKNSDKLRAEILHEASKIPFESFNSETRHDILKIKWCLEKNEEVYPNNIDILYTIPSGDRKIKSHLFIIIENLNELKNSNRISIRDKSFKDVIYLFADKIHILEDVNFLNKKFKNPVGIEATLKKIQDKNFVASGKMRLSIGQRTASVRMKKGRDKNL